MKPLLKKDLSSFLKRFDSFRESELHSIEIITPTTVKITLTAQDSAREFDWIVVALEFSNVSDAQLPQNSKLAHIDMSEGITIIFSDAQIAFGIGNYDNFPSITNSICSIKAASIKYEESSR